MLCVVLPFLHFLRYLFVKSLRGLRKFLRFFSDTIDRGAVNEPPP